MSQYRDPRELRAEAERLIATADALEAGVWQFVCEVGGTPTGLAERLGITPQAANNRLKRLYDLGLVERRHVPREGGGRSFAYTIKVRG